MSSLKGNAFLTLVSTILPPIIGQALYPMTKEFADQLIVAMNLSGIARPFVWLCAVSLALMVEIGLVLLFWRLFRGQD